MPDSVKSRRYDAARRREQSMATRRRILAAARELYLAHGYRATTVAAIARSAGVNVDTVYHLVGRKPVLLRELIEEAISGAEHPVAAEQRDYVLRMRAEPDPGRKLEIYAAALRRIQVRLAPLLLAMRDAAAADAEAAAVWRAISERRAGNMRLLVADLRAAGGLRDGLTDADAADTVWLLNSPDVYALLTGERGWPPHKFEQWLAETWKRLLLR